MPLRGYLTLLSVTDLAFLFFLLALVLFLERLTRRPAVSAVIASGLLCLPWPERITGGLPDPLAYLRWQIEPAGFAAHIPPDSPGILWRALLPPVNAPAQQMIGSLLLFGLILFGLAAAAHWQGKALHGQFLENTEVIVHK